MAARKCWRSLFGAYGSAQESVPGADRGVSTGQFDAYFAIEAPELCANNFWRDTLIFLRG
jgi:hypothetical protein